MYGFHFLVWFLCVRGIKDTQVCFIIELQFNKLLLLLLSLLIALVLQA